MLMLNSKFLDLKFRIIIKLTLHCKQQLFFMFKLIKKKFVL